MNASDFTHAELGVLLMAIGTMMVRYDLCVGAAMDGAGNDEMVKLMSANGVDLKRAEQLVELDMVDVIEVVHMG